MSRSTGTVFYHSPNNLEPVIHVDVDGVPGRQIFPELEARTIQLFDVRTPAGAVAFAHDGLVFVRAPSAVTQWDDRHALGAVYEPELQVLAARELGAVETVVFDHTVRTEGSSVRAPARHAHGDYSPASARQRRTDILGDARAREWARGHFAIVNAWRPLRPVAEAPLAFARPSTVDAADWIDVALVYPDRRGQVSGLLPSEAHQWLYMPAMTPDDIVLFRVHDSQGRSPVAHSAIDLDDTPADAPPRQSIESRILVRFA